MPKENGLGITTYAFDDSGGSARNIRASVTNFEVSTPRAVQDATGLDKFAIERLLLLADINGTATGVFNDEANGPHDVFKSVPSYTGTRTHTLTHSAQTLTAEVVVTDYAHTRAPSGEWTWAAPYSNGDGSIPAWS
jgi:hypothetical protein